MNAIDKAIEWLIEQEQEVTSEIIKDLITEHQTLASKMKANYKRYTGEDVPILKRTFDDESKPNNKIINPYEDIIVDEGNGYLMGTPIDYKLDRELYSDDDILEFKRWHKRNDIADLDSETDKKSRICGYAARLCYIDKEGTERVMQVDPWETIFIQDGSLDELQFALRYYSIEDGEETKIKVEWYDDTQITYYIGDLDDGFKLDNSEQVNPQPHMFNYCPLIKFINNDEEQSDFEKVIPSIDAYNKLISDSMNEAEQFTHAYMKFKGMTVDEEEFEKIKRLGGIAVTQEGDVDFITKNINDTFIQNLKTTLEENIYKFSKTVNMSDEKFSGASQSGESRKWKLLTLEFRAIIKERKFSKGLRQMFKVLASSWQKRGINIDYLDIDYKFIRNIPIDLSYWGDVIQKLKGNISDETLYSILPFVEAMEEIEKMNNQDSPYSLGDGNENN